MASGNAVLRGEQPQWNGFGNVRVKYKEACLAYHSVRQVIRVMHPVYKRFLHLHHRMPCFSPCGLNCMTSGIVRPVEAGAAICTLIISMASNLSPWAGLWRFAWKSPGASQCTTHCCFRNYRCHRPHIKTTPWRSNPRPGISRSCSGDLM